MLFTERYTSKYLNIAPMLECLDQDFVFEAKRGKKFNWIYKLDSINHILRAGSAGPEELKRFRLEVIP